jgi:hypothetical protein
MKSLTKKYVTEKNIDRKIMSKKYALGRTIILILSIDSTIIDCKVAKFGLSFATHFLSTVKPVYNSQPRDSKKVVFVPLWLLFIGCLSKIYINFGLRQVIVDR